MAFVFKQKNNNNNNKLIESSEREKKCPTHLPPKKKDGKLIVIHSKSIEQTIKRFVNNNLMFIFSHRIQIVQTMYLTLLIVLIDQK